MCTFPDYKTAGLTGGSQSLLSPPEGDKSVYAHCTYHFIALGDFDLKAEVNV